MAQNKRLGDLVEIGTWEDVRHALERCQGTFVAACDWIVVNLERNNRNLTLYNLLKGTVPFMQSASEGLRGPVSFLAFCTRNVFEINLRARHILQSDGNLQQWIAEAVTDNIQVLEGVLSLRQTASPRDVEMLEAEIERIRAVAQKHQVSDSRRLLSVSELAKAVGQESEYRAFFRIYSKLVHPSSYLLNSSPDDLNGSFIRTTLVIHLQLYAYDLLGRIRRGLGVPDEVCNMPDA